MSEKNKNINNKYRLKILKFRLYISLLILICFLFLFNSMQMSLHSKNSQNEIDSKLYISKRNKNLNEIDRIEIKGNSFFTDAEVSSILTETTSRRNTIHKIIEYYYFSLKSVENINKYLPPGSINTIELTLKKWSHEIRYFDEAKAESDLEIINEFYKQNGFHDIRSYFSFQRDTNKHQNVLTFYINEGERYKIKDIVYYGLDSVVNEVERKISRVKKLKKNTYFKEEEVISEIRNIKNILLDNGYFFAGFETPVVSLDTAMKTDSLTIEFQTGRRQKISHLTFVDSLAGQKKVTNSTKSKQLSFSIGDWYNRTAVEESRQNLQSLGTFELVSIDTSTQLAPITDTTIPIKVFTRYRKAHEGGASWYINETVDNFINTGIELSYINRNLWGSAQSLNFFARSEVQDISRWIETGKPETEFQLGTNFAQPFLWKIGNSKVSLAAQGIYSISKILTDLRLNTTSLRIKFPTQLPPWTYFNHLSVDFLFEWEIPGNFTKAKEKALENADSEEEKQRISDNFSIYENLNNFYKEYESIEPSAVILGISLSGDSRDDLFNPSKGYFTVLSADSWLGMGIGIAKYSRAQFSYNYFTSLNKYTVFALKARSGYIHLWADEDYYVPFERQFFAGGANSARGWDSRSLRYATNKIIDDTSKSYNDFINDFIGSRMILEGSFEFRWRFGRPRWASDLVADIINMGVLTGFIDWGNTYHWIAFKDENYYNDMEIIDYITGIAVSAGFGFGIQTPVGPLRIDVSLPIYDPTPEKGVSKFVLNRPKFRKYTRFHIGLGYAF
jgi:outer membrane protein assembly factor BamA